jgi:hypothetical protein
MYKVSTNFMPEESTSDDPEESGGESCLRTIDSMEYTISDGLSIQTYCACSRARTMSAGYC